jgi:hypothetical protein
VDDNAGVRNAYYYDGPNGRTFYRYDSSPEFIENLKKYFTIGNAETSSDDRGYITNLYKLTPNGIRFREVNEPHDAAWENLADYKNAEGEGEGTPPFPM